MGGIMKFKFKKFLERGVKKYRVLGWEGVKTYNKLPAVYTQGYPCIYEDNTTRIVLKQDTETYGDLRVNETLSEKSYERIITFLRDSGDRLHQIRKQLKKENANWSGEFEVLI